MDNRSKNVFEEMESMTKKMKKKLMNIMEKIEKK